MQQGVQPIDYCSNGGGVKRSKDSICDICNVLELMFSVIQSTSLDVVGA